MPLLQLSQLSLAYGHVPLLDRVDFVVDPGERIGLIGRNGTGKSSLLRIIEGLAAADDGKVWRAPQLKLASVSQEPAFRPGQSVFEAVAEGLGEGTKLLVDYHAATHALTAHGHHAPEDDVALMERVQHLQEALDASDGWSLQHRIEATLSRLQLLEDDLVSDLSGGLKKRVALARALVMAPDLLLLDEPTNHLDFTAIEWLEETLLAFPGSVLVVTHDRRFLDSVVLRIVELDRGRLSAYPGNFSAYQQKKMEALETEAVHQRKFDKVLAQEEVWIRKGIEARRTRNEGRVRRLEALRLERAARRDRVGKVGLELAEGERSGRLVADLEEVGKHYGDKQVVKKFTCRILRGDKVGLIGPNGSGKTTLLKLILGEIRPDSGKVHRGTKLSSQGSDHVEVNGVKKHVIGYLGDFLFPPERVRAPVKSLSGGERNRLLLARLFSRPANVLVLDEPTNDLDIETLELLESLLQEYAGTLFLVSHDREFLDNVVTQTIASEGGGEWKEYAGGYSDWQRVRSKTRQESTTQSAKQKSGTLEPRGRRAPGKAKLGYKEGRELAELPARLQALEREQEEIAGKLADPALYRDRAGEVKGLQLRHAAIEAELAQLLARWEELEAKTGIARSPLTPNSP